MASVIVIPPDFISGRKFQLIYNQIWNLHCSHSLHIDALSKAPSNAIIKMHGMLEVLEYIFLQYQEILLVLKWFCFVIYFHISTNCDLYQNYQFPFWNFWWSGGSQFEISNRALARIFLVEILFPPPTKWQKYFLVLKHYSHQGYFWCRNIIPAKNIFGVEISSPPPMK